MRTLNIDIETYSGVDLKKVGVYKYTEHPEFTILLFAFSFDDDPVKCIELEELRRQADNGNHAAAHQLELIKADLLNPNILKTAHNAAFEMRCLAVFFDITIRPSQWSCTMAYAATLGLPLSLDHAAKALNLPQKKMSTGKALIKYFCSPCAATRTNGMRTRNRKKHNPEKWAEFKAYNIADVEVEKAIRKKISFFKITDTEKRLWQLDKRINDYGLYLDQPLVNTILHMNKINRSTLTAEATELTGLSNANSPAQLIEWLGEQMPLEDITSLRKQDIDGLRKAAAGYQGNDIIQRVLDLRTELSKTSVKKYNAMRLGVCRDGRVRGLFQYYGANRTGRWAGRLIQVHNLPKNELKKLDLARRLAAAGDLEALQLIFGSAGDVFSQLIRTAFIAPKGKRFIIADFSAIEARVIAWLAGEQWRLEVFRTHGKIYEASASKMFNVPIEQVTKGSQYRQKGKVAELALGFGGGVKAILKMMLQSIGSSQFDFDCLGKSRPESLIPEEQLPGLVKAWRTANPQICKLWRTVETAAIKAVQEGIPVKIQYGITFSVVNGILFVTLPSGRKLSYIQPTLRLGKFDKLTLWYRGMNQETKQWGWQNTYGGKLVENIVQAIARDCLGEALLRVDDAGYTIPLHVHDEIVTEEFDGEGSTDELNAIMSEPIAWAPGLLLKAESYETHYYKKD